jgi:hypothetical protein
VGHSPTGAMTIEKREAEPYDEVKVLKKLIKQGPKVVQAHIDHLAEHKQEQYLSEALEFIEDNGFKLPVSPQEEEIVKADKTEKETHTPHAQGHHGHAHGDGGCPGAAARDLTPKAAAHTGAGAPSQLTQWPVQLHLLHPQAPYLQGADLVLAADCSAYAVGDFHSRFLTGKKLAIACPKLDRNQQTYLEKLVAMINGGLNTLSVIVMEVPCCQSLVAIAQQALQLSSRKIPLKKITVGIEGDVKGENWVGL